MLRLPLLAIVIIGVGPSVAAADATDRAFATALAKADLNGDGALSADEIGTIDDHKLREAVRALDRDGDGVVTLVESRCR